MIPSQYIFAFFPGLSVQGRCLDTAELLLALDDLVLFFQQSFELGYVGGYIGR